MSNFVNANYYIYSVYWLWFHLVTIFVFMLIIFWQILKLFDQLCHCKFCVCACSSCSDNLWIHHSNWVQFGYKKPTTLKIVTLLGLEKRNMLKIMTHKSTSNLNFFITHKKNFKYLKKIYQPIKCFQILKKTPFNNIVLKVLLANPYSSNSFQIMSNVSIIH